MPVHFIPPKAFLPFHASNCKYLYSLLTIGLPNSIFYQMLIKVTLSFERILFMSHLINGHFTPASLLKFAAPSIIMMMFMSLYTIIDGIFISRFVGSNALSSINIVYPIINIVFAIGTMLGTGGNAIISRYMGEGKDKEAKECMTQFVVISLLISVVILVLTHMNLTSISRILGASDLLLADCDSYLSVVLDGHGEPYHISGDSSVVFKMQDKTTGKCYALKCFTKAQKRRADAYCLIAEELEVVESQYVVSVKYLEKELLVCRQGKLERFPVLLMDWVDGHTLGAFVAANYQNQSVMSMLCYRFGVMAAWLRSQSFAHGDIAPDNIIVRPNGFLTLVDYDGMFVSTMKGWESPSVGSKDFCHPLRTVVDFDETIDDFSLASIALSLKAISMNFTLLDTYGASDRLLFSEKDYRTPSNSKVISALQGLMCDKDFCTLYSLFMLALARKELSTCSFRLFVGENPNLSQPIEDLSTKVTEEDLNEAITDEFGVKYSKDGRKLLKAPYELDSTYSIKEGVKIICERAFFCCGSLSSLVIPDSVTRIGNGAFNGCYYLKKLEIPDGVTRLGEGVFEGCSSLGSLVIPDSVTSIEDRVFNDCHSLKSLVIPDGVTSIGEDAFASCESLKSLVIPASVVNIKGDPFYCWTGKLRCLSPYFIYEDNVLFDRDKSTIISFRDIKATSYTIPDSVTSIGERAFCYCESLTSLVIPDSVASIGDGAFEGCESLKNLVIPDNITSIGKGVFQGCSSLTDIVIPNRVTSIGEGAFFACNSLTSIVIPSSVICIGTWAFYGCESLKSLVIPDSVTIIGDETFYGCCFPNELKQELISRFGNRIFVKP